MVLCIIALPLFAVLGIFSVRYRSLTRDALDCLFKTITLRKCESKLDERIKSKVTGKAYRLNSRLGRIIYQHFKVLSWIFLILTVWSAYLSGVGVYNYWAYGNCNGPDSTGFCMLDPTGEHSGMSNIDVSDQKEITLPTVDADDPIRGDSNAELTIIEFGCYQCPFTKKAEPVIKKVLEKYDGRVNLQFKSFIIPNHLASEFSARAVYCAFQQNMYERYHKIVFERQQTIVKNETYLDIAQELGMNRSKFINCVDSSETIAEVKEDHLAGLAAGVRGTPTFFINDKKIVGPKPFRTFKRIINKELKELK